METYYILNKAKLYIKEETLVAYDILKNRSYYIPLENTEKIVALKGLSITSEAAEKLLKKSINVYIFKDNKFLGLLTSNPFSNFHLKQYESFINYNVRINIAKKIILALYYNFKNYFEKKGYNIGINTNKIVDSLYIEELMGYESKIWKQVYDYLKENLIIKFKKRDFNPPRDEVNALLSFLNSLLYVEIFNKGIINGFNMDISYLHAPKERALVFDISEIYKPLITIPLLIRLINQRVIREEHFLNEEEKVYLNEKGRFLVIKHFKERLNESLYSKKLKNRHKIKNLILYEFLNLKSFLKGKSLYYEPFYIF